VRRALGEAAAALARPGRYRTVADNLRVKEVAVAPGGNGDGDQGARTQRFVICHNPEQADRDQQVRANWSPTCSSSSTAPTAGPPGAATSSSDR
jgi:hypothetical protein